MAQLLLLFSTLIALSDTLALPTSPDVYRAQSGNESSLPSLAAFKAPPISNAAISNSLALLPVLKPNTTTPSTLDNWPPLPFTSDTGSHLDITITILGPITSRTRQNEFIHAVSDLYYVVADEGDLYETISGVYARSSGIVWTIFDVEVEGGMKRFQFLHVLNVVWFFMLEYGPGEVVRSEILLEVRRAASFVLSFRL
ncbi:MAG: hypothetical protein Q9175_007862 [Cornicularia normoerica]